MVRRKGREPFLGLQEFFFKQVDVLFTFPEDIRCSRDIEERARIGTGFDAANPQKEVCLIGGSTRAIDSGFCFSRARLGGREDERFEPILEEDGHAREILRQSLAEFGEFELVNVKWIPLGAITRRASARRPRQSFRCSITSNAVMRSKDSAAKGRAVAEAWRKRMFGRG